LALDVSWFTHPDAALPAVFHRYAKRWKDPMETPNPNRDPNRERQDPSRRPGSQPDRNPATHPGSNVRNAMTRSVVARASLAPTTTKA
jgi:hypothetical protein